MYNLISKTVLINVLQSINNNKIKRERERGRERERTILSGNVGLTVIKGGGVIKMPLRDGSKSSFKIFSADPFVF